MRITVLLSVLCVAGWLVSGCQTGEKSEMAAKTYECPDCKDSVSWVYGTGGTGLARERQAGKKVVVHSCSMCKKEWEAGITSSNTCPTCNKADDKCPACKAHG